MKELDLGKIDDCISRFVEAEADFVTDGNRGIGRMLEHPPRFGAYFRKQLRNMQANDLLELKRLMSQVILTSYVAKAIMDTRGVQPVCEKDAEALFQSWIPNIYAGPISSLSKDWEEIIKVEIDTPLKELFEFLERHNMKFGAILPARKRDAMFWPFVVAGFDLRAIETIAST